MTSQPELITIEQAAMILGCSSRTIRRRIDDGTLTGYRVGPRFLRLRKTQVQSLAIRTPLAKKAAA